MSHLLQQQMKVWLQIKWIPIASQKQNANLSRQYASQNHHQSHASHA
jgi:hypothetical protein